MKFHHLAPTTIYVSGPMRGLPDENKPEFDRITRFLREAGHTVFNPAENQHGLEYIEYIKMDFDLIAKADALYVLKNWQWSWGANREIDHAVALGKNIFFQTNPETAL